jgi:hypothetical protein
MAAWDDSAVTSISTRNGEDSKQEKYCPGMSSRMGKHNHTNKRKGRLTKQGLRAYHHEKAVE